MPTSVGEDKKLYITDLDGTLLDPKGKLSDFSAAGLNQLIENGIHFSVATARTPATVTTLLKDVALKLPIVVMNGAALYHTASNRYDEVEYIPCELVEKIKAIFDYYEKSVFMYCIEDNKLTAYYERLDSVEEQQFYEERKDKYLKQFIKGVTPSPEHVVYFTSLGKKTLIHTLYDEISSITGLHAVAYKDNYFPDTYYLEVYSEKVSKAKAIKKLQARYGDYEVVCFGDNLNDLPMFEMAQESYAVANAVDKVKEAATAVIESNLADGVVKYLLERLQI